MPTELVLLSEVEATNEAIIRAGAELHPEGTFLEYRGGQIRQFVDGTGQALLAVYRTRPISIPTHAARMVIDPPQSFSLWTDLTVPYGDQGKGRELAEALATAIGGVIKDTT